MEGKRGFRVYFLRQYRIAKKHPIQIVGQVAKGVLGIAGGGVQRSALRRFSLAMDFGSIYHCARQLTATNTPVGLREE